MSKRKTRDILAATPEELELINRLTARPVFERLDTGDLEIVDSNDWSKVPELAAHASLFIPKDLYRKLVKVSRKRHTTPDQLAATWLAEHVKAS